MKKVVILFVVVSLSVASSSLAQLPRFQQVIEMQIAPAHQPGFENMAMKIKEAADKLQSPVRWYMFQVAVGKSSPTYRVALGFNAWSERDQWRTVSDMLTEAFGEQETARILRDGRLGIVSEVSRIWELLDDGSSHVPTGNEVANFYEVQIRRVDTEMVPEYRELQRKWKAAYESVSNGPAVSRWILRYGDGAGHTFRRTAPFETWAERGEWGQSGLEILRKYHGEEGQRVLNRTQSRAVVERVHFVSAYRPDLSRPAPTPTSD